MEPDVDLVAEAVGSRPIACRPARRGGYTRSGAWHVETATGPAFVKQADDEGSLLMLRREALVYSGVSGPFIPALVGFADVGERAVLAIEYLPGALWPPPYPEDVTPLFAALELAASAEPPLELPTHGPRRSCWERVASDLEPFLALGLCSREWFALSVETLIAAEEQAPFEGNDLVHNDIYSGNVCFRGGRAVLVDWGAAVRGSRWIDVAQAVLSVRAEGGVVPPFDFPHEAGLAAARAGELAVEAPAPLPAWAEPGSTLREDMVGDLRHALGWAVEVLGLPQLTSVNALRPGAPG